MLSSIVLVLLLAAVCYANEVEQRGCQRLITATHLKDLMHMHDSQMKTTCKQAIQYVDKKELNDPECFLQAAFDPVRIILDNIEFKSTSPYSEILKNMRDLLNRFRNCFSAHYDDVFQLSKQCVKNGFLTPQETLEWVHDYFSEASQFLIHKNFTKDCSRIFEKCSGSQEKDTISPGVVTDRDCKCPATSPIYGGGSASLPPAFGSFSSMANQLDSKATVTRARQLPGTTQMRGESEGSTRSRVIRSTHASQGATESMNFRADSHASLLSPPEGLVLATVSQASTLLSPPNTALLLDQPIMQHSTLSNVPPSPSGQQHTDALETESPPSSSAAGSSQTGPSEFLSQHSPLSTVARSSIDKQWLQTRGTAEATPGLASDSDRTVTSGIFSQTQTRPSFTRLEPVDGSGVPSSGSWVTHLPSDADLFHGLGSEDPVSAVQHPPRLVATRESSSSAPVGRRSWDEQGSRGRAPRVQKSTQLRERRAEREEGLAKGREPEDSMPGPSFDQSFLPPNTEKHIKKSEHRDTQGMTVTYVTVPSVLGILLAVGGLLFYLHRSRISGRRQLQRDESTMESAEEGRPLNERGELLEMQVQGEL
ncbi:macrophage colony-stimulating factor 1 isoform X2 [Varanus komodoensis]|uniref:Macrophage colony-stimulating factor 1 n=1 Tax=Varanus komodoensis TaxID=61221 RepID=A0A8D2J2C1_VARKO|nr:macrophage colony-stimulating factor 1 isoform X2 [Varanus komodoensis]